MVIIILIIISLTLCGCYATKCISNGLKENNIKPDWLRIFSISPLILVILIFLLSVASNIIPSYLIEPILHVLLDCYGCKDEINGTLKLVSKITEFIFSFTVIVYICNVISLFIFSKKPFIFLFIGIVNFFLYFVTYTLSIRLLISNIYPKLNSYIDTNKLIEINMNKLLALNNLYGEFNIINWLPLLLLVYILVKNKLSCKYKR